jgi:hypothetical protein
MQQNVQFSSRLQFPSITGFEIVLLVLSIIIGTILISFTGNPYLIGLYTFVIFLPVGMNIRDIKSGLTNHMIVATFILIGINFIISIFAYYTAVIGIILYFIVILHRYRMYQKMTGN